LRFLQIVDAPIAVVAAWEMAKMSRENMKEHVEFGGLDRDLLEINHHQNIYHVVYDLSIPRFLPRQWVSRVVWKWTADKKELTVVYDDVEHVAFQERKEYLRASVTSTCKYMQEAEFGATPQTRVTYTVQVDLGGRIPKWVQNRQGVGQLMYVRVQLLSSNSPNLPRSRYLSSMRKRFDKSAEIDAASSLRMASMIRAHEGDYTDEEIVGIDTGKDRLKMFERMKTKNLKTESPSTEAKVAFEDNDSHAWGRATTTVRAE